VGAADLSSRLWLPACAQAVAVRIAAAAAPGSDSTHAAGVVTGARLGAAVAIWLGRGVAPWLGGAAADP
jgi:hypothetical protein